ncbi:Gfo/Idh/MocA family protein [Nocardiopsis suaedae]|uniref:Gfo/Idh/MocA family oxidoreductase n=1 Tax=Nocardiopsis suaedae TaxID=3018444 RepID=A0ABT4TQ94_9ACTN|nr:Gfo/Idh/MocA family oxidoreductase [Nocardiopsis suaedae]MDA2806859.1 Gfo/Idh/MocA family oxidoreductase [Nocardiopsis suaedae]
MLGIGIIGCGSIGGFLGRLLSRRDPELAARARLVGVAARDAASAGPLAAELGCAPHSTAGLLARADVDAVVVCTPSGTHAGIGEAALEAGKHVLVEKPVDVSPEAAERLVTAARRKGAVLGVVSQHRFDPAVRLARSAIEAGELGRLTSVMIDVPWWRSQSYYSSGTWRGTWDLDGGGALMNQAVHAVDVAQWLAGPVVEASAFTGLMAHRDIEVEDTVAASLRFASGALGTLLATTAAYPGRTAGIAVNGDRGSVVVDDDELAWFHTAREGDRARDYGAFGDGDRSAEYAAELERDRTRDRNGLLYQPHRDQLADFCDAVREGRRPLVDGEDGRRAVDAVAAVYASARTGTVRCPGAQTHDGRAYGRDGERGKAEAI